MRRIKLLKTISLGLEEPSTTLCPGHVDAETFNKASAREGWNSFPEGLEVTDADIKHEYWQKVRRKGKLIYRKVDASTKGARPFTVNHW